MIPELPTDVSLKPVLAAMVSYFEMKDARVVGAVDWADAVPEAMLEALNGERGGWVLRTNDSEFMFGYKASEFISAGAVYVPLQVTANFVADDP